MPEHGGVTDGRTVCPYNVLAIVGQTLFRSTFRTGSWQLCEYHILSLGGVFPPRILSTSSFLHHLGKMVCSGNRHWILIRFFYFNKWPSKHVFMICGCEITYLYVWIIILWFFSHRVSIFAISMTGRSDGAHPTAMTFTFVSWWRYVSPTCRCVCNVLEYIK